MFVTTIFCVLSNFLVGQYRGSRLWFSLCLTDDFRILMDNSVGSSDFNAVGSGFDSFDLFCAMIVLCMGSIPTYTYKIKCHNSLLIRG